MKSYLVNKQRDKIKVIVMKKIRGIPLHTLSKSRFCPAINILAYSWSERKGQYNPILVSWITSFTSLFFWGGLVLTLILFTFTTHTPLLLKAVLFSGFGLMLSTASDVFRVKPFAQKIRALDTFLVEHQFGGKENVYGLPLFPSSWSLMRNYLVETVAYEIALSVRREERRLGTMAPSTNQARALLTEYKKLIEELGFALYPYPDYFRKADQELDAEEAAKRAAEAALQAKEEMVCL